MKNYKEETKIHVDKSKKVPEGPFYFLTWIFKTEFMILVIFFLIWIVFNFISDKTKFVIKYNIQKRLYSDIKNENYNYKDITNALKENNFIKNEEKEFISNIFKKEIEENKNYIDINKIIKRLKTLEISYYKKYYYNSKSKEYILQNSNIEEKNIAGSYNAFFNKINIYEKINKNEIKSDYENETFDFERTDKKAYFHELNHLLAKNTFQFNYDNILLETINEIFTREYFGEYLQNNENIKNDDAYEKYMMYIYALAEILPEDIMRKYKFNNNESILISGLLEIDNNIDKAYKLINSINKISLYNKKEEKIELSDYKNIHDGYAYFYEKKYHKNMFDDIEILLYFYGTYIQTNEERNVIRNYLEMEIYDEIIKIIPKGYFSKEYKQKHSSIQVKYTQNGKEKNIEINNI